MTTATLVARGEIDHTPGRRKATVWTWSRSSCQCLYRARPAARPRRPSVSAARGRQSRSEHEHRKHRRAPILNPRISRRLRFSAACIAEFGVAHERRLQRRAAFGLRAPARKRGGRQLRQLQPDRRSGQPRRSYLTVRVLRQHYWQPHRPWLEPPTEELTSQRCVRAQRLRLADLQVVSHLPVLRRRRRFAAIMTRFPYSEQDEMESTTTSMSAMPSDHLDADAGDHGVRSICN